MDYSRATKADLIKEIVKLTGDLRSMKGSLDKCGEANKAALQECGRLRLETEIKPCQVADLADELLEAVGMLNRSEKDRIEADNSLMHATDALGQAECEIESLDFDVKRLNKIIDALVG